MPYDDIVDVEDTVLLLERAREQGIRAQLVGPPQECESCGCTDDSPCEGGCWWVRPRLCSACIPPFGFEE